jgi:hypothetical protein
MQPGRERADEGVASLAAALYSTLTIAARLLKVN